MEEKVDRIRAVTDSKLKFVREQNRLSDQAFEHLKEAQNEELDVFYEKN